MPTKSWSCRVGASSSAAATNNSLTRKANTHGCGRCNNNRRRLPPYSKKLRFCSLSPTEKDFTLVLGTSAYCLILFAFFLRVVQTATKSMLHAGHGLPITNKPLAREDSSQCKENFIRSRASLLSLPSYSSFSSR